MNQENYIFKPVATFDNFLLANMTLGLLQENGINCHLKDENIITIDPLLNPAVGGIKLMVLDNDLDTAKAMLVESERNYLLTVPCPKCQQPALELVERIDKPQTVGGKLKNMIFYGQETLYSKKYRCSNCGNEIKDLPEIS